MTDRLPPARRSLLDAIRSRAERDRRPGGIAPLALGLARIGVLGWQIVAPTLAGLAAGRWLDRHLGSGIFWTAPLLILGTALGCWSAWKWIGRQ